MSATTSEGRHTIACPNCHTFIEGLGEHGWTGDEDEERKIDCGDCGKTITLRRIVQVSYEASCE